MGWEVFHWVHGIIFAVLAVGYIWSWVRGGFWVPRYVHIIAFVALIAGIWVTATLPPSTNPNPVVQFAFPFILPGFFTISAYAVAICCGYVEKVRRIRRK